MPGCFEKFIFELEAFSYSIGMGLSLAKQLTSPQKMFVSSAKFTILISWSPACPPLILEIAMEIEEWKQKVPSGCVKSFSRVLLSVLETSIVS